MFNGRLYRAAFLPFAIALAVAAFSLGGSPGALHSTLAPDAFEGQPALAELESLAAQFPRRRPGSAGDQTLAAHVAAVLEGLGGTAGGGFTVHTRRFSGQTIDGERGLSTVIAERPGASAASPIMIIAHRDAAAAGARAELSATAALLELARVLASRETQRTVILVSTSGGSGGDAGVADLLAHRSEFAQHGPLDAVIVLGDLAGDRQRKPFVIPYSDGAGSAPVALQRTVDSAIAQEVGADPGAPSIVGQLAHLAFHLTVGEQGPLDGAGIPAVLVQVSGERGPGAAGRVSAGRLEGFGRGVLSAIEALDSGPDVPAAMQSGLLLQRKTVPAWALRMLVGTLLLPALVVLADGLARARRRRLAVARAGGWALFCAVPFAVTAIAAILLGALGILGAHPAAPVPPGSLRFDGAAAASVAAMALVLVLSWLLWPLLLRRVGLSARPQSDAAGVAAMLVLLVLALFVWGLNPLAALLLAPALHLWLLIASPELRPRRPAALVLVALGLLPLALLIAFYAHELDLGIGRVASMAVLLLAGGQLGLPAALLWSIGLGCAAAIGLLAISAPSSTPGAQSDDKTEVTIRGPLSYAGPGSLGGTQSALRR